MSGYTPSAPPPADMKWKDPETARGGAPEPPPSASAPGASLPAVAVDTTGMGGATPPQGAVPVALDTLPDYGGVEPRPDPSTLGPTFVVPTFSSGARALTSQDKTGVGASFTAMSLLLMLIAICTPRWVDVQGDMAPVINDDDWSGLGPRQCYGGSCGLWWCCSDASCGSWYGGFSYSASSTGMQTTLSVTPGVIAAQVCAAMSVVFAIGATRNSFRPRYVRPFRYAVAGLCFGIGTALSFYFGTEQLAAGSTTLTIGAWMFVASVGLQMLAAMSHVARRNTRPGASSEMAPLMGGDGGAAGLGDDLPPTMAARPARVEDLAHPGLGWKESCAQSPHMKAVFFTTIVAVLLGLMLVCEASSVCYFDGLCEFFNGYSGGFWGTFAAAYVFYWIEVLCSSSFAYLRHTHAAGTCVDHVETLKRTPPKLWWHIQCYHYETRTRTETYTDSNGNSQTRTVTETVRVNTHSASGEYTYRTVIDTSGPIVGLERFLLTKINYTKRWTCADADTARDYSARMRNFIAMNDRDTHYDFSSGMTLPGFVSKQLAEVVPGVRPATLSAGWFLAASSVLMTVPFRMWFGAITGRTDFMFKKSISMY